MKSLIFLGLVLATATIATATIAPAQVAHADLTKCIPNIISALNDTINQGSGSVSVHQDMSQLSQCVTANNQTK